MESLIDAEQPDLTYIKLECFERFGGAQMFIPSCVGLPLRILTTIGAGKRADELGGFTKVSRKGTS